MMIKAEEESLYNYEIAGLLNVAPARIGQIRKELGLKRGSRFTRGFEHSHGAGAVDKFKAMIEDLETSLSGVAKHFGFSREYARQVYEKIYGCPYSVAYKEKLKKKKEKRTLSKKGRTEVIECLKTVKQRLRAMRLDPDVSFTEHSSTLKANGFRLSVKSCASPYTIGKKRYFRFSCNPGGIPTECDFFICRCAYNECMIHYVIPRAAMPKCSVSLFPDAGPCDSKYAKFKEAWHLLKHKNGSLHYINKTGSSETNTKRELKGCGLINFESYVGKGNTISDEIMGIIMNRFDGDKKL